MEGVDKYIDSLAQRLELLTKNHASLKDENGALKTRNDELESHMGRQKNMLNRLQEQNKVVKIAKAVTENDDDRKEKRKRLNELVREIDKCIALLNN